MTAQADKSPARTPDSYDANIIPAETAARIEREGENYKQLPENVPSGYTVDKEGLINNYAIEPEMYVEAPGDVQETTLSVTDIFTIVDTFSTCDEAENVATEKIEKAGIAKDKISILGKDYEHKKHVHGSLKWNDIKQDGGLANVLVDMGIAKADASQYEKDIETGKFLLVVSGTSEDMTKTQKILQENGHRVSDRQVSL
jgi:hypothetical protein